MDLDNRLTIVTPEGVDVELIIAGVGSRAAARCLDTLIQVAAFFGFSIVLGVVGEVVPEGFVIAGMFLMFFVVFFLYDLLFELASEGQTPGKRASGIRVVTIEGAALGTKDAIIRNLVRIVDFLPFLYGIGCIAILATQRTQRLGDLAAGTIVVRERTGATKSMAVAETWAYTVTVTPEMVSGWDVSGISAQDLAVVRHFLDRRMTLPTEPRWTVANDLVARVWPRVHGVPNSVHPEFILEGIVVAKGVRG